MAAGHEVFIQSGAGNGIGCPDAEYRNGRQDPG
ncbi:MAG: hypothetical protein U1E77_06250 [Inhella sp.]